MFVRKKMSGYASRGSFGVLKIFSPPSPSHEVEWSELIESEQQWVDSLDGKHTLHKKNETEYQLHAADIS